MASGLVAGGMNAVQAAQQAQARMYQALVGQASILSYLDTFRTLAVIALVGVPLVFVLKKVRGGGEAPAH